MIKNIIFDLGGVILNIDYNLTSEAFKRLGVNNFDQVYSQAKQSDLFDDLEVGKISAFEFRNKIREICKSDISDNNIDKAWNAMLLDLPAYRIEILKKAAKNYKTFLLSNTNEIHLMEYSKQLQNEYGIESLDNLFKRAYYSHEIGLRKPNVDIFAFVTKAQNLKAEETLFIDDSIQHIKGAMKFGLKTYFMDRSKNIELKDIFKKNGDLKI